MMGPTRNGAQLITNTQGSASGPQPADFTDVRATNLAVVLRFVRENAPCSRADIAASTGLNKATVSSLVADLIDRRLLRETGLTENRVGRPATMLVLDGSPYAAVGIEVNVDYLTAVAVDLKGEELLSWRRAFPGGSTSAGQAVAGIAGVARRVVNRMTKEARQVLGLTVAVPGLVDLNGSVRLAPNMGWRDVDLAGDLAKALRDPGFPVSADNDANLGALAELRFGSHGGAQNLVYLTGEIGVGAGVVLDGRLRRGGAGFGGEIGHIEIVPGGPPCHCGRHGCLEVVAGLGVLLGHSVSPAEVESEIDEVVQRAETGDEAVLAQLDTLAGNLGRGLGIVANLLNPEVVVLGGYYVKLAPWIVARAEQEMLSRSIAPGGGGCRLVVSGLGYGAAALGAAARVLDSVDSGRLPGV